MLNPHHIHLLMHDHAAIRETMERNVPHQFLRPYVTREKEVIEGEECILVILYDPSEGIGVVKHRYFIAPDGRIWEPSPGGTNYIQLEEKFKID